MAEEIFKRVEKKYLLNKKQKKDLIKLIDNYIEPDLYSNYSIYNIYFDTDNYDLIKTSIEKPLYKEKLRLRSYGTPTKDTNVFLEIKKKFNGVVGKRRVVLKLNEAYDYLNNKTIPNCNKQILNEIDYMFEYYDAKPKMFISYDRLAYHGKEDNSLRITFDYNIIGRDTDLNLESGNYGKKLLDDDKYIMEIKTLGAIPMWLSNYLTTLEIYPTSFSKYGNIYKQKLKEGLIYNV